MQCTVKAELSAMHNAHSADAWLISVMVLKLDIGVRLAHVVRRQVPGQLAM